MASKNKRAFYNARKMHEGQVYTGMKVGGKHSWNYNNGTWNEIKIAPDEWKFNFSSIKVRKHEAPQGTGAEIGTEYHWYVLADQKVVKLNENSYDTKMTGQKFKIGYKRPNWKTWDYYYQKETPEDRIIRFLEDMISRLKARKKERELSKFF
ncbi:MAG: hypothetical protein ACXQS8_10010 [Candidatus Helarchaeales archaeon]